MPARTRRAPAKLVPPSPGQPDSDNGEKHRARQGHPKAPPRVTSDPSESHPSITQGPETEPGLGTRIAAGWQAAAGLGRALRWKRRRGPRRVGSTLRGVPGGWGWGPRAGGRCRLPAGPSTPRPTAAPAALGSPRRAAATPAQPPAGPGAGGCAAGSAPT